jgi:type III pantothenate kinase
VVHDGATGVLVPPRDPAALARALGDLLRDAVRAKALGQEGRRRVGALTPARVAARFVEAVESLRIATRETTKDPSGTRQRP